MSIKINELLIRVAVNVPQAGRPSDNRATTAGGAGTGSDDAKKAMVSQCIEQVLQILDNKTER